MDPRTWNMEMTCTVNVGLGTGSRDKDLQSLLMVKQMQDEILTTLGPGNPFVTPIEAYNLRSKMVETLGFESPEMFIRRPSRGRGQGAR